jgi:hypothetical protein
MVEFDPKFTETVFFDLECYVPPNDRQSRSSLIFNPTKEGHFVLGGVFRRGFPLQQKLEEPWHVWNWEPEKERDTLMQIYEYFKRSWDMISGKLPSHPDLILIGIGISRFDIPVLYIRSLANQVASASDLYETYFKTKVVDLTNVGIALSRNTTVLYPKTANDLTTILQIQSHKKSGKKVWDMFDSRDYDAIKVRTASEVEDTIQIASRIMSGK